MENGLPQEKKYGNLKENLVKNLTQNLTKWLIQVVLLIWL